MTTLPVLYTITIDATYAIILNGENKYIINITEQIVIEINNLRTSLTDDVTKL